MSIKQGVRKGCLVSAHLFALYNAIIRMKLDNMDVSELVEEVLTI